MPPMPPTSPHPLVTPPDAGAIAVGRVTPAIAPRPQRAPDPRESVTGHALHPGWTICLRAAKRGNPETTLGYPKKIRASFFSPAQARVGESAPFASDATSAFSANARPESFGTAPPQRPKKTRAGDLSAQAGFPYASTGNYQPAASPTTTPTDTVAPVAERRAMAPKHALELKRLEATSPYAHSAWQTELSRLGLLTKYPRIVEGFKRGFDLGIARIHNTYTPPNHPSNLLLSGVYSATVSSEFAAGRYIGPFSRKELEAELGPPQTSPLSFVPKFGRPTPANTGRYLNFLSLIITPRPKSIPSTRTSTARTSHALGII